MRLLDPHSKWTAAQIFPDRQECGNIFKNSNETIIYIRKRMNAKAPVNICSQGTGGREMILSGSIEHVRWNKEQPQTAYFTAVYGDEPVTLQPRLQELMKKQYRAPGLRNCLREKTR